MSNSDSFIEEVTEELQRDKLFGLIKRYGWIAALVVIVLVGGAAWFEYSRAQTVAKAQGLGDSLFAALEESDADTRFAALSELPAAGDAQPLVDLLKSAERLAAEDPAAAAEALRALSEDMSQPVLYRDLAGLKLAMIGNDTLEPEARDALLERLATPGAPFRLLAMEQQIYARLSAGDREGALSAAEFLSAEQGVTPELSGRLLQVIVALGGEPEAQ